MILCQIHCCREVEDSDKEGDVEGIIHVNVGEQLIRVSLNSYWKIGSNVEDIGGGIDEDTNEKDREENNGEKCTSDHEDIKEEDYGKEIANRGEDDEGMRRSK